MGNADWNLGSESHGEHSRRESGPLLTMKLQAYATAVERWISESDMLVCCGCMKKAVSGRIRPEDPKFEMIDDCYRDLGKIYDASFS